ncbi:MAG: hypothetical protein IKE70_04520 [Bacilli bacterium]|nr:hypothetical protein [Bacilli bacterium]
MKYEDQVFNLSADAYTRVELSNNTENDEILKKQSKLLKILLKRFQEELKTKGNVSQGILKVKFNNPFWQDSELGYREIEELVKSNNFDSFASQYCFYLGDVEYRCDDWYTAYYEIIWDYKTYFEQLSMQQIDIPEKSNQKGNSFSKAIKDFKQLPINYQISILNSFVQNVEMGKRNNEHDIAVNTCSTEGHMFSKWKHNKWTEYIDTVIDHQHVHNYPIEHENWKRTCSKCGFIEEVEHEPQELIDERKEKNKKARIKRLERELKKLKSE